MPNLTYERIIYYIPNIFIHGRCNTMNGNCDFRVFHNMHPRHIQWICRGCKLWNTLKSQFPFIVLQWPWIYMLGIYFFPITSLKQLQETLEVTSKSDTQLARCAYSHKYKNIFKISAYIDGGPCSLSAQAWRGRSSPHRHEWK